MVDPCMGEVTFVESAMPNNVVAREMDCTCGESLGTSYYGEQFRVEADSLFEERQMLHRAGVSMEEYCGFTMAGGDDREMTEEELALVLARLG